MSLKTYRVYTFILCNSPSNNKIKLVFIYGRKGTTPSRTTCTPRCIKSSLHFVYKPEHSKVTEGICITPDSGMNS